MAKEGGLATVYGIKKDISSKSGARSSSCQLHITLDRLHAGSIGPPVGPKSGPSAPMDELCAQVTSEIASPEGLMVRKKAARCDQGAAREEKGGLSGLCAPLWRAGNANLGPQMQLDDLQKCASRRGREALFPF